MSSDPELFSALWAGALVWVAGIPVAAGGFVDSGLAGAAVCGAAPVGGGTGWAAIAAALVVIGALVLAGAFRVVGALLARRAFVAAEGSGAGEGLAADWLSV